jgi:hypothetical protein
MLKCDSCPSKDHCNAMTVTCHFCGKQVKICFAYDEFIGENGKLVYLCKECYVKTIAD